MRDKILFKIITHIYTVINILVAFVNIQKNLTNADIYAANTQFIRAKEKWVFVRVNTVLAQEYLAGAKEKWMFVRENTVLAPENIVLARENILLATENLALGKEKIVRAKEKFVLAPEMLVWAKEKWVRPKNFITSAKMTGLFAKISESQRGR